MSEPENLNPTQSWYGPPTDVEPMCSNPNQPEEEVTSAAAMADQTVLLMPEMELKRLTSEKEQKIWELQEEQCFLIYQTKQLQRDLIDETEEMNYIARLVSESKKIKAAAAQKIKQLQRTVDSMRKKRENAEVHLGLEKKEAAHVMTALVQAENQLYQCHQQLEDDKHYLLQPTSSLKVSLSQAQEDLVKERNQWTREKLELLQSIRKAKRDMEQEEEIRRKTMSHLLERIQTLEHNMREAQTKSNKITPYSRMVQFLKN